MKKNYFKQKKSSAFAQDDCNEKSKGGWTKKTASLFFFLIAFLLLSVQENYAQGTNCSTGIVTLTVNGPCGSGTLSDTTEDGPTVAASSCQNGPFGREGWYQFTVSTGTTNISISATGSARNIMLQLISGTCGGALTEIACANNITTNGAQTETMNVTLGNGTYFLKITNLTTHSITLSNICITSVASPSNDNCVGATSLTVNPSTTCTTTTAGTTVSATQSLAACGAGTADDDVWYQFVATASSHTVTVTPTSLSNAVLEVFSGSCGPGSLISFGCVNATTGVNAETTTLTGLTAGNTYYVRVYAAGAGSGQGTFTMCVNTPSIYCTSNSSSSSYHIDDFSTTGGLTNITNNNSGYSTGGYGDFTGQSVSQYAGSSFNFSITMSSSTHGINIWIDWNNDGDFNDTGEKVYASGGYVGSATGSISIPSGTAVGNYRMRVVTNFLSTDPASCGTSTYTETEDYTVQVPTPPACSGTPTAGTTSTNPTAASPGSSYTVSATGFTIASGLTYQWQYSTNGGTTWTNQGAATGTYSNYTATAPAVGTTVLWHLIVTCTSSGQSATSTNGTFNSVNTLNIPATGNNTVSCGTNIVLYDNGGVSGNYANSSSGYTVLEAGLGASINISGSYTTESVDRIRIYSGIGTGGTLLATYSGNPGGTINYTGTPGETLTVEFTSDGSVVYSGFSLSVTYSGVCFPACAGTPTGGTVTTNPTLGAPGSSYSVIATGYTQALNLTYQWQYSTNGGTTWTNAGAASSTYSNYTATAPALGTTVLWHLIVTCTTSSQSATSTNGSFTSVNTLNVPASGNNTNNCGTNIVLYDNGGASSDYANSSNGYTVLEAGLGATINISGSYRTEGVDYIRIYSGIGTGGTLLATYSGNPGGTINYTGTPGQTLTVQFTSDGSIVYSGFSLAVSYSGVCFPACAGTPSGGTVTTSPNTVWPGSTYTVSATGYSQALNLSYQWQYSTDNGATWTNAGAASSTYSDYTANAPISGVVLWQLAVTCSNSGITSTSTTGTFTTMVVNTTPICPDIDAGGLGLSGADPAPLTCASGGCTTLEATYLNLGNTTDYLVQPIPYNPPFAFNNLANPVSVNIDDRWSAAVNLPFDFCFYGNTYNQCVIGSNGVLSFDMTKANTASGYSFSNNLPSTVGALFGNSIYGVYHDIDPSKGGEVGWELITLSTGCRALVASWYNVPMFSNNSLLYTGMMVLYENTNVIEVFIKEKRVDGTWNGGNAIVGVQNAAGTAAVTAPGRNGLDTDWTVLPGAGEAWRFVPFGASISTIEWFQGATPTGPVIGNSATLAVCPSATTTYTAQVTYTLCNGVTLKKDDQTTVTVGANKTWNGSSSTNWNTAANWTPSGVPTAAEAVIVPNTVNKPLISGGAAAVACSLSVQSGATVTVNPANTLTVTNAVTILAGGDLILEDTGSLVQINNSANSGTAHIKRTTKPMYMLDYSYWNSPVTTASAFTVGNLTSGTSNIFRYTPTQAGGNGIWTQVAAGTSMNPTFGIIARAPSTFPTSGPKQTYTTTFVGTPNNGDITMPISKGTNANLGSTVPSGGSTAVTDADDEWNLIGNPYPSAINIVSFLTDPANVPVVDGTIYLWTHNTPPSGATPDPFYGNYVSNYTVNDYATVNNLGTTTTAPSGGTAPTQYIASGQSFFISADDAMANGTTQNAIFKNSMRVANNNANFLKTNQEKNMSASVFSTDGFESQRVWLNLSNNNGGFSQILVGYAEGATLNWDRGFDGEALAGNAVKFYSLGANKKLTIQGRFWPFNQTDLVPLGYKATAQGNYTIGIDHFDTQFNNQNIYLEDKNLNVIHDLKVAPYSFTSEVGEFEERFVLRYTNNNLSNDEVTAVGNSVIVYTNDKLNVKSTLQPIREIMVYDVLGKLLLSNTKVNANEFTAITLNPTQSTLIVKVTLDNGVVVNKKVIY